MDPVPIFIINAFLVLLPILLYLFFFGVNTQTGFPIILSFQVHPSLVAEARCLSPLNNIAVGGLPQEILRSESYQI